MKADKSTKVSSAVRLNRLVKEWLQTGDDLVFKEIQGLLQNLNDISPSDGGILERYEHGAANLHIHARVRREGNTRDFCAVIKRTTGGDRNGLPIDRNGRLEAGNVGDGDMQRPVFVGVRQLLENPERIGAEIPSLVWLRGLDDVPCRFGNAGDLSLLFAPLEFAQVTTNWKLVFDRDGAAYMCDESANQVIQGSAHVGDAIPSNRGDSRVWTPLGAKHQNALIGGQILIGMRRVIVNLQVDPNCVFDRVKVLLCPINLQNDAVRQIGHG